MNKNTSTIVKNGLMGAGGLAIGRIVSNMSFAQANPALKVALPVVGAILTTKFLGNKAAPVAVGMVAGAAVSAVQTYAPGVAAQVGLSGVPYRSLYSPGVAGHSGQAPRVRVVYN